MHKHIDIWQVNDWYKSYCLGNKKEPLMWISILKIKLLIAFPKIALAVMLMVCF
jgi:hypothetical protein